jgi:hypothetical protein
MITRILSFILLAYAANTFSISDLHISPWYYDVSGRTFAEWHKQIDFYMSKRMPFLAISGWLFHILFLISEGRRYNQKPFIFVTISLALQILTVVLSLNSNVSLNPEMNAWNPDALPANWQAVRDEWLSGHARNWYTNTASSIATFLGCYYIWTKNSVQKA